MLLLSVRVNHTISIFFFSLLLARHFLLGLLFARNFHLSPAICQTPSHPYTICKTLPHPYANCKTLRPPNCPASYYLQALPILFARQCLLPLLFARHFLISLPPPRPLFARHKPQITCTFSCLRNVEALKLLKTAMFCNQQFQHTDFGIKAERMLLHTCC